MKDFVAGSQASAPFNGYDSTLALPQAKGSAVENAVLTLVLRTRLNFIDSTNPNKKVFRTDAGGWFARDYDGWSFPILNWTGALRQNYAKDFKKVAENFWSEKILLRTPSDFSDFDYVVGGGGSAWRVRPNVQCRLRIDVMSAYPHRSIDVYRIAPNPSPPGQPYLSVGGPGYVKPVLDTQGSFRSDDKNYRDADPYVFVTMDAANHVAYNVVTHEVGHALGQSHIEAYTWKFWLHGHCKNGSPGSGDDFCYGDANPISGVGGAQSRWNVMGAGDRLDKVNAISWTKRIAEHTGRIAEAWGVQINAAEPPRRVLLSKYGPPNPLLNTPAIF